MFIKKPGDFISSLVLIAFVGLMYYESQNIRASFIIAYGPKFFPYAVLSVLTLLAVILALQSIDFSGKQKPAAGEQPVANKITINKTALLLQFAFIAAFVVYLILMPRIGYLLSTILFLFSTMVLLGDRKPKELAISAASACALAGGLYYIFTHMLQIFLP